MQLCQVVKTDKQNGFVAQKLTGVIRGMTGVVAAQGLQFNVMY